MWSMAMRRHVQTLMNECRFYDGKNRTHMVNALAQLKGFVEEMTCSTNTTDTFS
jgi:hypothetical protein